LAKTRIRRISFAIALNIDIPQKPAQKLRVAPHACPMRASLLRPAPERRVVCHPTELPPASPA